MSHKIPKIFKVMTCGAVCTGKSELCAHLSGQDHFRDAYIPTIGVDFSIRYVDGINAKIQFWDLSGDPRFDTVIHNYIMNNHMILFVYSVHSLASISRMKELYERYSSKGWIKQAAVVGTHTESKLYEKSYDLHFQEFQKIGQQFAEERDLPHFLVDNRTKYGLDELQDYIHIVVHHHFDPPKKEELNTLSSLLPYNSPNLRRMVSRLGRTQGANSKCVIL